MTSPMTKDFLLAHIMKYGSTLNTEEFILIGIFFRHLLELQLPDRNQNISKELPEIISNAINTYMTAEDPEGVTLRGECEQILGREISIEEDRDKIVFLLEKITGSEISLT